MVPVFLAWVSCRMALTCTEREKGFHPCVPLASVPEGLNAGKNRLEEEGIRSSAWTCSVWDVLDIQVRLLDIWVWNSAERLYLEI